MQLLLAFIFFANAEIQSRKVSVTFNGTEFAYDAYLLSWGDGKESYLSSDQMPKEWVRTHTYEQNGTYIITLTLRRGFRTYRAFSQKVEVKVFSEGSKEASP